MVGKLMIVASAILIVYGCKPIEVNLNVINPVPIATNMDNVRKALSDTTKEYNCRYNENGWSCSELRKATESDFK